MASAAGGQMFLGIRLQMDASGVVTGASVSEQSLRKVENAATRTQTNVSKAAVDMGNAMKSSMGLGVAGAAAIGISSKIESGFVRPMIDQAKSFQFEMSQLGFVTKATQKDLQSLEQVAIRTGLLTQFSPQEAAKAIRLLKAAGLETKDALNALQPALDVATGSGGALGLAEAATSAAVAFLKFKHTGETSTQMMDTFANATRESNLQFHDLPIALNSMRSAPQLLKMSSTEVWTLVGALRNAGMTAAESGQSLSGFARNLVSNENVLNRYLIRQKMTMEQFDKLDASQLTKGRGLMRVRALKELGVSMFDLAGKVRPARDIVTDLVTRLEGLSGESERKYLMTVSAAFSDQAKNMLIMLKSLEKGTKKGAEAFQDMFKAIGANAGAGREAAAAFENTQAGLEQFIKGTEETIAIIMGKTLLPIMKSFHVVLRNILNAFLEFVNANPTLAKALSIVIVGLMFLTKIAGVLLLGLAGMFFWSAVIGPALTAAGGFAGIAAAGFGMLQAAIWPVLIAMGAIVVAVGLVIGSVKLWKKIWASDSGSLLFSIRVIFEQIQRFWKGISELWGAKSAKGNERVINMLKEFGLWGLVTRVLAIKRIIVSIIRGVWDGIKDVVIPMGQVFYWVGVQISGLIDWFRKLFEEVKPSQEIWGISFGWMYFGRVLGWVGGVVIGIIVVKALMLMVVQLKSAVVWMARLAFRVFVHLALMIKWIAANAFLTVSQLALAGSVWVLYAAYAALAVMIAVIAVVIVALWIKVIKWAIKVGPTILKHIVGFYKEMWNVFRDAILSIASFVSEIYMNVVNFFEGVIAGIANFLTSLPSKAVSAATGFISAFLGTLKMGWDGVKSWFTGAMQWIRDILPGSDAKFGPLSDLTASGRGLMNALGTGVESGTPELRTKVTHAVTGMSESVQRGGTAVASAPSKGGPTSIIIEKMEFNVAGGSPEELERIAREIMARIRTAIDDDQEVAFA